MSLEEYKKKRDFGKTQEPEGRQKSTGKNIFVVQKHKATRLHYDLRLEMNGILKSWAVPKGPSLNPKDKRLAIETEDHPIEYATFEGTIPENNYGAGTVIIWDKGIYKNTNIKEEKLVSLEKSYEQGHIIIELLGDKLQGEFALIKMKGQKNKWLLIKKADEKADRSRNITNERPESVKSGKKIIDF
ncbi:MAG: DNA ligase D, 3'-phosphoesterase domain protein [Promethearchaeota archaeon]|nr:MAG: DNA ligase D, 3'-phosphoesterase domain protein [Candidatus Lokiarchaeota archaeon]